VLLAPQGKPDEAVGPRDGAAQQYERYLWQGIQYLGCLARVAQRRELSQEQLLNRVGYQAPPTWSALQPRTVSTVTPQTVHSIELVASP